MAPNVPFVKINIVDIPIDDLLHNFSKLEIGLGSMRGLLLIQGSIIRSGMDLGFGMNNPQFLDRSHYPRILEASENEVVFEKIRREVNPSAPSRLSCIFAGEDSLEQRIHIGQMLSHTKRPYIMKFRPKVVLNYFVADSTYFDLYSQTKDTKYAYAYWRGQKKCKC